MSLLHILNSDAPRWVKDAAWLALTDDPLDATHDALILVTALKKDLSSRI
jgi:hypothetical protein